MLTLTNIKKVFKTDEVETWALQNVNLEVKKGEFVAIMGPSGCGKSTLLNILGLLDTPTEGAYILDGKDVSQMSEDDRTDLRKGKLGFVFQSFNLIDELNVSENVELPLLYMGVPKKERRQKVKEVIERVTNPTSHTPTCSAVQGCCFKLFSRNIVQINIFLNIYFNRFHKNTSFSNKKSEDKSSDFKKFIIFSFFR